ncbi:MULTISPECIES: glycosyltransferase family 2 protein [unclassified Mucilaginibacter]|uniref:glycosyltransferase family 2 protein n=1 Tax=unclassified Mucilaginibacter TaxID=2617802 RepID=UPI002AC8B4C9|nr:MULTISPECIES: glycosyltransferase family 2 protein [unclassified Mucilaginibacter]MEB0262778.1 glycosyltransferase family 2 protein [Mucilaginibacter sp. 10I4]MEB0280204.1 glycosyltransferase family 2 protein [Mucilaginibacter sp. 10B2]MEB0301173.1 glycosyltransferase family 2 protein [Mucilaginibacter sp. 5C4]WPX24387.1 glycosyltransferase family 2 protein [Mucilaginibacter sp. 5C4]
MVNEKHGINPAETNNALLSIIVVTYNAAKTLQTCLDSVFMQTYPNLELIVIDGNSTDGTQEILKANTDKITNWKSEPDSGIYDAMTKALAQAKGEWIYFLGADDELLPDFSAMALELANPNFVYYGSVLTRGLEPLGPVSDYYLAKHGIIQQSIIYPKVVFERYAYNLKYRSSADFALNMQALGDKDLKFVHHNYVIAHFADTGVSGQSRDRIFERDKPSLILKNFGFKIWLRFKIRKLKGKK